MRGPELTGLHYYLQRRCPANRLTLKGHSGIVTSVVYSPDGQLLASASGFRDRTAPGQVKLWSAATGKEVRSLGGHSRFVSRVRFSPDGKLLASAGDDRLVKVWDVAGGQEVRTLDGHRSLVMDVAFSSDSRLLASAGADGTVKLWDVASGLLIRSLQAGAFVWSISFSPVNFMPFVKLPI